MTALIECESAFFLSYSYTIRLFENSSRYCILPELFIYCKIEGSSCYWRSYS